MQELDREIKVMPYEKPTVVSIICSGCKHAEIRFRLITRIQSEILNACTSEFNDYAIELFMFPSRQFYARLPFDFDGTPHREVTYCVGDHPPKN